MDLSFARWGKMTDWLKKNNGDIHWKEYTQVNKQQTRQRLIYFSFLIALGMCDFIFAL